MLKKLQAISFDFPTEICKKSWGHKGKPRVKKIHSFAQFKIRDGRTFLKSEKLKKWTEVELEQGSHWLRVVRVMPRLKV